MKFCPNCRENNPQNSNFCTYCGEKLISTNYCSHCGTEIKANMAFCPECGNKIDFLPESQMTHEKNPISVDNEILDVILVARREKGKITLQRKFMIFYRDFLIIVKGMYTKSFEELSSSINHSEKKLGKELVETKNQLINQAINTSPEILKADPENIFLKYDEIDSIKMSQDFLKRSKIQIISNTEIYKYDIEEYKLYKKYIQFLKSIFGNKVKT